MKYGLPIICLIAFFLQGCDLRSREESLKKKEAFLQQREQEFLLREKTLQLKEEELNIKQQRLDSVRVVDTLVSYNTQIAGIWNVKMT